MSTALGITKRPHAGRLARIAAFAWVPIFYLIAAVIFSWPLARHSSSVLVALEPKGDSQLNLWILGWDLQTLFAHPSWLLTGRIFDANIFYPAPGTLAYADHLLLQALAVGPLYGVTHNLALCYNAIYLCSLVLSAWAMYAFVRSITGNTASALVAGLIWGFCPYRFSQLSHLQLQPLYWMPLTMFWFHRLALERTRRAAVGLGSAIALQAVSSIYYAIIGGVGLVIGGVLLAWPTKCWRDRRWWSRLMLATAITIVIVAPAAWPYWRAQQREGFGRNLYEASHGAAVPADYLKAPPINFLFGRTGWLRPAPPRPGETPLPRNGAERDLFPGFVVLALAIAGLVCVRARSSRPFVTSLAAMGVAGFVLSLGPNGWRTLYVFLYEHVYGFQIMRASSRFSVLVFFALAGLAGLGVQSVSRLAEPVRERKRTPSRAAALIAGGTVLAIGIEFLNGVLELVPPPPTHTAIGHWLATATRPGAVVYLPLSLDIDNTSVMVASLEHRRPIVNGYSGQRPTFYEALVQAMSGFPSVDALLALKALDVPFAVAPAPLASAPLPLVERARFPGGETIYELVWTPEIEASFLAAATEPAPAPGPFPFHDRETARYRLRWLSGPMTVPAGEAILSAVRSGLGFRFTVEATAAEWVHRFYTAAGTLETVTSPELLPATHRQAFVEGRRHITRFAVFDPTHRQLRLTNGQGQSAISLPLSPAQRDPISAYYLVRTLPLHADDHVRVPISDLGNSVIMELTAGRDETVTLDGKPQDAAKIALHIERGRAFRPPLEITAWLSRDARRVPIVIELHAEFGLFRAELVDYHEE